MNIRLLPPTIAAMQTRSLNGRTYTGAPGNVYTVLDTDAAMLEANGWIRIAPSGPTSSRPTGTLGQYNQSPGAKFYDETLGEMIVSDGVTWRSPVDGSSV